MPKDINYAANERGRAWPSIICFKLDFGKWDRYRLLEDTASTTRTGQESLCSTEKAE